MTASRLSALWQRLPLPAFLKAQRWTQVSLRFLPFADAATTDLPLGRLLRLSLFQVSVGMATALLVGTLNRVMIVELGVAAWVMALMVALPLVFAPFRALVGFRSDTHRSVLGWKRVPYIWLGTLIQFGGLAIMPFALLLLGGDHQAPAWLGTVAAALAFLMVGAGMQTTQTAGLALATDLAPEHVRPRVVALMYVMLLVGLVASSLIAGWLLRDFTPTRLVQVVQGAAVVTVWLNLIASWKQEPRQRGGLAGAASVHFAESWRSFARQPSARRYLVALGLGTAAFSMQDVILEPYGGEVLGLGVSATTLLTGLTATGALVAFALAARLLARGMDAARLGSSGLLIGLVAFSCVIFAEPLATTWLFRLGVWLIGLGGGLFAVATLAQAMALESHGLHGLALGAWGAVQATCAGVAMAAGGGLRDVVSSVALTGSLGEALDSPATGYITVYHIELLLLFAALAAIGPLVRPSQRHPTRQGPKFGLAEFPR